MLSDVITELQALGLRIEGSLHKRDGGAGPAEGGTVMIDSVPAHVPLSSGYVARSPYVLYADDSGCSWLAKDGKALFPAEIVRRPKFYDYVTEDQVDYWKIALLHGKDCIASTVIQTCSYWNPADRCRFCGIELSLRDGGTIKEKTPAQLAEVIARARELDSVSHVVLTTGAIRPSAREMDHLAACAATIKKVCTIPIHVQFLPPPNLDTLYALKAAGVDSVGIHIESFDFDVLSRVAPVKAAIGLDGYDKVWQKAVEIFGENQVSSFVIVGLGEKESTILEGCEFMADRGVYPFIVPFRPIPGTLMQDSKPPDPALMKRLYESVVTMLRKKGLSSSRSLAGCVRCGACSAVQVYEEEKKRDVVCRPARNRSELAEAMAIRREVFVEEQELFSKSDIDEHDPESVQIIAEFAGEIIGSVRVFPKQGSASEWIGGRLAVRKGCRIHRAGVLLVREAMRCVKQKGCIRFTAHIQERNVRYFSRLGWKAVGPAEVYHGKPHQLMEADLSRV
jgi:radical SAM protein (TIGR04043 family)/putative N-acetyltransferase (TIGR04045 family)